LSIRKDFYYHRKARYYLSEEPSRSQQYLCFVLHGYGQLPEYFLKKFTNLERHDILFVAPEGLHRFYLNGSSGRVGSSWMTKEDRLNDIDDYCALLDQVADELLVDGGYRKVALLGFSQGVATAARWSSRTKQTIDELILWSGAFPPDLSFKEAVSTIGPKPLHLLLGDQDEYAKAEQLEEQRVHLAENGIIAETQLFKGGHTIIEEVLESLVEKVFPKD
jgi:predicted esterase